MAQDIIYRPYGPLVNPACLSIIIAMPPCLQWNLVQWTVVAQLMSHGQDQIHCGIFNMVL